MKTLIIPNENDTSRALASRIERSFSAAGDEATTAAPAEEGSAEASALREMLAASDLCVVIGGDGAVLHSGKLAALCGVPVLALNTGRVGFLTSPEAPEALAAADLLAASRRERRALLEVCVTGSDGAVDFSDFALNEAVISRGEISRIIDIEVSVDGTEIYTVRGDGVIIATPTGSTAYAMSAGGPIVAPEVSSVIVTPICPYTLTARSVVLPDTAEVSARVFGLGDRVAMLTVDGGVPVSLRDGARVSLRRSERSLELLTPNEASFYEKIKTKLFGLG